MTQTTTQPAPLKDPSDWAKIKKVGALHMAVAKRVGNWIPGRVVTEADFDAVLKLVKSASLH